MNKSIYSHEMIAVRTWLRSECLRLGLTMRELALRLDRPHSFVQRIEEGDRRLDVVEFVWYCQALGIDPALGLELILSHHSYSISCKAIN